MKNTTCSCNGLVFGECKVRSFVYKNICCFWTEAECSSTFLRISAPNVLKMFLNIISSGGCRFVNFHSYLCRPTGSGIATLYSLVTIPGWQESKLSTGDVALTSSCQETNYFHKFVQYPNSFGYVVVSMFLNFEHFSASCSYEKGSNTKRLYRMIK